MVKVKRETGAHAAPRFYAQYDVHDLKRLQMSEQFCEFQNFVSIRLTERAVNM